MHSNRYSLLIARHWSDLVLALVMVNETMMPLPIVVMILLLCVLFASCSYSECSELCTDSRPCSLLLC